MGEYSEVKDLKPKKRSALRLKAGRTYYTLRRYLSWYTRKDFAEEKSQRPLEYCYFSHNTPLLRRLKDVDMKYQYNKIVNLRIAVPHVDGIIIKPGETFSYWRLIGRPSYKKGYKDGLILDSGGFSAGVGGGLCQLSNLIYWMTLHTPLTVVERFRHTFDVFPDSNRTQPFGSGATCVYPYRDLMIRNDTNSLFQLKVWVTKEHLCGQWLCSQEPLYSYRVIEKNHAMRSQWWGAYTRHNEIYRKKYNRAGEFLEEEYITENHALMMYEPFIEGTNSEDNT